MVPARRTEEIVSFLRDFEPGRLPERIFLEFARLLVIPVVELVPLRRVGSSGVDVLLTRRSHDDPVWPGMLHTPGTILRPDDATFDDALKRILEDELANPSIKGAPSFVYTFLNTVKRGKEASTVFFVEVEDTSVGEFHPVSSLPREMVDTQRGFIRRAAERSVESGNR